MTQGYNADGKGQKIPNNVIEAVRFTAKTGFITRSLWHENFVTAKRSASNEQFKFLIKKDIFRLNKVYNDSSFYVLGTKGRRIKDELGLTACHFPRLNQLSHDGFISGTTFKLYKNHLLLNWNSESELKMNSRYNEEYKFSRYPDFLIDVKISGEKRTIALEYEKTQKAIRRYYQILSAYNGMNQVSLVIFICESNENLLLIQNALKKMNNQLLNTKVAVCLASEWSKSPEFAEIKMLKRTFALNNLCEKVSLIAPFRVTELQDQKIEN